MDPKDIIAAWRDDDYRERLSESTQQAIPESPVGEIDISDAELEAIEGRSVSHITVILTIAATELVCYSLSEGGTCPVGTFGCCAV